jgi:hypothetical protein
MQPAESAELFFRQMKIQLILRKTKDFRMKYPLYLKPSKKSEEKSFAQRY